MPDIFTSKPRNEEKEHTQDEHTAEKQPEAHTHERSVRDRHQHSADQKVHNHTHSEPLSSSLPHPEDSSTPGLFSSYCLNPVGIKFINQEPGERMVIFLRRHFLTNFPWVFFTIIFSLLPPLYFLLLNVLDFRFFAIPPAMTFVLMCFYYLLIINYAFGKFIVWFYHVGIITQKRLLDLDVDNILHYHLAETEMGDIVDVSYVEKGFFQSFFNFGDVHIQTQAIKANFQFEQTPKPANVADIITDLRPELKGKKHHDA